GPERPGAGDVVVVDVGGATTDVHSVVAADPEDAGLAREVVATVPLSRTVEGDLGMRWSAVPTVEAAREAGIEVIDGLMAAAEARRADPGLVPAGPAAVRHDLAIASAAVALAVRRHAGRRRVVFSPNGRLVERSGKDLREVDLLLGSGGVLRHNSAADGRAVIAAATGDDVGGGWLVPRSPRIVIDRDCVLAAAGLLACEHPEAAYALVRTLWTCS
ncbi:MAG: glutamate mutase L, partial [Actinomycetota bacterium]|nr:glutamate mutase L [Actinomycetota bacterium]